MKDLSFIPPSQKRSRYRIVRRRTLLTLALIATLATSAVVIQQWVWSGQNPHKTLDFDRALTILNNPKENEYKRTAALGWLQGKMLKAIEAFHSRQKTEPPKLRGDAANALLTIEKAAKARSK